MLVVHVDHADFERHNPRGRQRVQRQRSRGTFGGLLSGRALAGPVPDCQLENGLRRTADAQYCAQYFGTDATVR